MAERVLYFANSDKGRVVVMVRSPDVGEIRYFVEFYKPHCYDPSTIKVASTAEDARKLMLELVAQHLY